MAQTRRCCRTTAEFCVRCGIEVIPPLAVHYPVPIPDLTTQGAGKSWLSAIGSGGHDRARDISESVPCLLPAITYAGSPPGVDDRGLAAGCPVVVRGTASAASPNYNGTALAVPPLRGTRQVTQSLGSDDREGFRVGDALCNCQPRVSVHDARPGTQGRKRGRSHSPPRTCSARNSGSRVAREVCTPCAAMLRLGSRLPGMTQSWDDTESADGRRATRCCHPRACRTTVRLRSEVWNGVIDCAGVRLVRGPVGTRYRPPPAFPDAAPMSMCTPSA